MKKIFLVLAVLAAMLFAGEAFTQEEETISGVDLAIEVEADLLLEKDYMMDAFTHTGIPVELESQTYLVGCVVSLGLQKKQISFYKIWNFEP